MNWAITTASKSNYKLVQDAIKIAEKIGCPYISRSNYSIEKLKIDYNLDFVLILDRNNRLFMEQPHLTWHPGMAIPRLRRLADSIKDPFLEAAEIHCGDKVLDCTLGLASDALIASWAVGKQGLVTGLEASPIIAAITAWGLIHECSKFDKRKTPLSQLSSRIKVININALNFLKEQKENSWDIIYFDPMFHKAIESSSGMNNIRPVACYDIFDQETLKEALRVARKKVVLKERTFSQFFNKLICPKILKSKYGPVAYGIWEK